MTTSSGVTWLLLPAGHAYKPKKIPRFANEDENRSTTSALGVMCSRFLSAMPPRECRHLAAIPT